MPPLVFDRLVPDELIETIGSLERRIEHRLPGRNLLHITAGVKRVAGDAAQRCQQIQRPNVPLRILIGLLLAAMATVLIYAVGTCTSPTRGRGR